MSPNKQFSKIIVGEQFKIVTEDLFRTFMEGEERVYVFPSTLSSVERAWVHNYAKTFGLTSKSYGKEPTRELVISKPDRFKYNKDTVTLSLADEDVKLLEDFFSKHPHKKEPNNAQSCSAPRTLETIEGNVGSLTLGFPQLPTQSYNNDFINFRMSLPIWQMRDHLMKTIVTNQITLVYGETGCGKTTQLPQFILDYARSCNDKCRVICTQPRRISAVSVAERVAAERNEKIGQSVGYQIRLESCVGPRTVLIYCTNGILLRTLMNGEACLNSYTHIIVDEIHERDRFSDFLLICLRECLVKHPHLRLILMSATVNIGLFERYFSQPPVVHVQGRLHPVQEYFLEDVLNFVKYSSPAMLSHKSKATFDEMFEAGEEIDLWKPANVQHNQNYHPEMDECILECIENGTGDSFAQLLQLILSEHAPINYQHSETGLTGLMAAANHGCMDIVQQLLSFGAEVKLRNKDNYSAYDFACAKQHIEIAELLKTYEKYVNRSLVNNISLTREDGLKKQLLDLYQRTTSDAVIDYDLIVSLIAYLHLSDSFGSILVFLPGYDDIVIIRDKLQNDPKVNASNYQIFTLHSSMQMSDQHRVFNMLPNKRKIILATNIAETSITIDDVVFVIDSGKVKEKCYDAIIGICTLQSTWISQACAKQRAGRAGRTQPGICFHMFSQYRHSTLQAFSTPEILRIPLHELCLQTKMLAPQNTKIADFLSRALEPPSSMAVETAITHLQDIDALDNQEQLTPLGNLLVDIPIEPRLAKMLIYSVIFKCLDPVLTLVACMAYRDPFILPNAASQKNYANNLRKSFSANTFSDHVILIRAFQAWQDARIAKEERSFCSKNFISSAIMEMVVGTRTQLLAQLRACGFVKTKPPGDIREININSYNWPIIKAVIACGLYPHIACIKKSCMQIKTKKEKRITIHQSSSLRNNERSINNSADHVQSLQKIPSSWLIFDEMSRTGNHYNLRSITCISQLTVALFIDNRINQQAVQENENCETEIASFTLNEWITFEGPKKMIALILNLREKINMLITKKICFPNKVTSIQDENLSQLLATLLSKEDAFLGLYTPQGIGQRPKMLLVNMHPAVNDKSKNQNKANHVLQPIDKVMNDILRFKPVANNQYVTYTPKNSQGVLEYDVPSTSGLATAIKAPVRCNTYQTRQNQIDMLTQNLNLSLGLEPNIPYQNANYGSAFNSNASDFESNGVDVADDSEPEGACGISVPSTFPHWITTYCNPIYTRYFIIKAGGMRSLEISISKKTWIFSPQTEHKLLKILKTGKIVMLIFSVANTGAFQGIARLMDGPGKNTANHALACPIDWLSRADIYQDEVAYLNIPMNVDGFEVAPHIGTDLCLKFTNFYPKPPAQMEPCVVPMGRPIRGGKK